MSCSTSREPDETGIPGGGAVAPEAETYQVPENEAARLAALRNLGILDTPAEEKFDRITRIAQAHFRMPVVRISLVDEDRVWFKSRLGISVQQAPRSISICSHAILDDEVMVIPDLREDPRFAESPQVSGKPHFRFYAGAPIAIGKDLNIGAVCLMDYEPHPEFSADDEAFLKEITSLVVDAVRLYEHVEQTHKEEESRLKRAAELAGLGHYVWDLEQDKCTFCSDGYARLLGMTVEEYMESCVSQERDLELMHEDDRERYLNARAKAVENKERLDIEYRIVARDGVVRHVRELEEWSLSRNGVPLRSEGTIQDITEQKKVEEHVRQAHKMEAVGQLTGGIAHDFNNLLAVILGSAELLEDRLGEGDRVLTSINRAAQRGSELTQRLLAFSRKQPLRPEVLDLSALTSDLSEMLERTLEETFDLDIVVSDDLWPCFADANQVENAILNLVLNACDAMPAGGRLIIECGNGGSEALDLVTESKLLPGDYVVLSVSDDGIGMSAEVQAHAFEPFFTTKDVGKGSGLGLSMVCGFAEQSGGLATIHSEEGIGTTIRIFLPRANSRSEHDTAQAGTQIARGQGERIVVIEDDADVRHMTVNSLSGLGYRVQGVENAKEASFILNAGEPVDLVLSDIVLPGGISGLEFAAEAKARRPGLKVILMSGYPADVSRRCGPLVPDDTLLRKPFRRNELADLVRKELDTVFL